MKPFTIAFLVAMSVTFTYADTIQVTIGGNLGLVAPYGQGIDPFDSSIYPIASSYNQSPFPTQGTLTFTYDSTAQPSSEGYYESVGSSSLTFGDYNESVSPLQFTLGPEGFVFLPGQFQLANGVNIPPIVDLYLTSPPPTVTLSTLQTLTLSQINAAGSSLQINPEDRGGLNYDYLLGPLDAFSVVDLSVPEPSTWALLLCGLGFVAVMARRVRV